MKAIRFFLGLVILAASILAVSFLQKKFDEGDIQRGIAAVRSKSPEVTGCFGEILSRVRGEVRIRCGDTMWRVDLLRGVMEMEKNGLSPEDL